MRHPLHTVLRQGLTSQTPIPTRVISNEEFLPPPQTLRQASVEALALHLSVMGARQTGMTRRAFLRSTGGMAAVLLAMNSVFGRFFDVWDVELVEAAAFQER